VTQDEADPDMRIEMSITNSFAGLAGIGIGARVRRTRDGLVITRSRLDIAMVVIGLLGFGLAPLYFIGADGIRLILAGDFDGERALAAISPILMCLLAILFIRTSVLRRPVARVSRQSRSIDYRYAGYGSQHIDAKEINGIRVLERSGMSRPDTLAREIYYAVNLRLSDGNDVDIATLRSEARAQRLAGDVGEILGIRP